MCGPENDEGKAARKKFLDEFSAQAAETICEHSIILSSSASSPIFDGRTKEISVPPPRRNGSNKNPKRKWIH
jgi:hypothetical protein